MVDPKILKEREDRKRYEKWRDYAIRERKNVNRKRFAMFSYDKYGNILGFCNDSFSMSNRYGSVHLWNSPPLHYYDPRYYFIVRITKQYPDIRMYKNDAGKMHHTFKGNYAFQQVNAETGEWVIFKDQGVVKGLSTLEEGKRLRLEWMKERGVA